MPATYPAEPYRPVVTPPHLLFTKEHMTMSIKNVAKSAGSTALTLVITAALQAIADAAARKLAKRRT